MVSALVIDEPHCSAVTINRKLSAVGSFYTYHHRHGVDCGELLTTIRSGGSAGSWRPFLAHLGSDGNKRRRTIKFEDTAAHSADIEPGRTGRGGGFLRSTTRSVPDRTACWHRNSDR